MRRSTAMVVADEIEIVVRTGKLGCALLCRGRLGARSLGRHQIRPGLIELWMLRARATVPRIALDALGPNQRRRRQAARNEVAISVIGELASPDRRRA